MAVDHTEFPSEWFAGLAEEAYISRRYNRPTNKYKVKSGNDQAFWEGKGWIHAQVRPPRPLPCFGALPTRPLGRSLAHSPTRPRAHAPADKSVNGFS